MAARSRYPHRERWARLTPAQVRALPLLERRARRKARGQVALERERWLVPAGARFRHARLDRWLLAAAVAVIAIAVLAALR